MVTLSKHLSYFLLVIMLAGCRMEPAASVSASLNTSQQRKLFSETQFLVVTMEFLVSKDIEPTSKIQKRLTDLLGSEFVVSREEAATVLGIHFKATGKEVSRPLITALNKETDVKAMAKMIIALKRLSDDNRGPVVEFLDKIREESPTQYERLKADLPDFAIPSSHRSPNQ